MKNISRLGRNKANLIDMFKRQLKRSVKDRINFGFVYTYKPVLDDEKVRIFDTMADLRRWCNTKLPRYLGYRTVE